MINNKNTVNTKVFKVETISKSVIDSDWFDETRITLDWAGSLHIDSFEEKIVFLRPVSEINDVISGIAFGEQFS